MIVFDNTTETKERMKQKTPAQVPSIRSYQQVTSLVKGLLKLNQSFRLLIVILRANIRLICIKLRRPLE